MASERETESEAEQLIQRLLEWSVSNLNTRGNEYITCHTYHSNAFPKVIRDAMKFRGYMVGHLRKAREARDGK